MVFFWDRAQLFFVSTAEDLHSSKIESKVINTNYTNKQ